MQIMRVLIPMLAVASTTIGQPAKAQGITFKNGPDARVLTAPLANRAAAEPIVLECNVITHVYGSSSDKVAELPGLRFSAIVEINLNKLQWREFWTAQNGNHGSSSGRVVRFDDSSITLFDGSDNFDGVDGHQVEEISRITGAYTAKWAGIVSDVVVRKLDGGECAPTNKQIPSKKF